MPERAQGDVGQRRAEPAIAIAALLLFFALVLVRFGNELVSVYQWFINRMPF
jgi:hypothetical protein